MKITRNQIRRALSESISLSLNEMSHETVSPGTPTIEDLVPWEFKNPQALARGFEKHGGDIPRSGGDAKMRIRDFIAAALAVRAEHLLDPDGRGEGIEVDVERYLLVPLANEIFNSLERGEFRFDEDSSLVMNIEDVITRIDVDYFDEDISEFLHDHLNITVPGWVPYEFKPLTPEQTSERDRREAEEEARLVQLKDDPVSLGKYLASLGYKHGPTGEPLQVEADLVDKEDLSEVRWPKKIKVTERDIKRFIKEEIKNIDGKKV